MDEPSGKALEPFAFDGANIRRASVEGDWFFSVEDVVLALTDSADPKQYIKRMRSRDPELSANWGTICTPVAMKARDGKTRNVTCASAQGILRIVQSVPSPKAEPLKAWLAKVGRERLEERADPSTALERLIGIYLDQGRTPDWIRERIDGIMTRRELTDEWKARGVEKGNHYMTLTKMLQTRSVGLNPKKHRELKGLKDSQSLRDQCSELELLFTRLGERSTIEIAKAADAKGYEQNREAVILGGELTKQARLSLEKLTGKPVATRDNFLTRPPLPISEDEDKAA